MNVRALNFVISISFISMLLILVCLLVAVDKAESKASFGWVFTFWSASFISLCVLLIGINL